MEILLNDINSDIYLDKYYVLYVCRDEKEYQTIQFHLKSNNNRNQS